MGSVDIVRQLRPDDAEAYATFRRAALLDCPLAFMSSPEDDPACSPDGVRERLHDAPNSVIFGAFQPDLIGTVGIYRDRQRKALHKTHVWGMYVAGRYRQQGVGAQLLQAAIQHARSLPGVTIVHLGVSSAAPAAQRLYERLGFRIWGSEPDALNHNGQIVIEHHMFLRLVSEQP